MTSGERVALQKEATNMMIEKKIIKNDQEGMVLNKTKPNMIPKILMRK